MAMVNVVINADGSCDLSRLEWSKCRWPPRHSCYIYQMMPDMPTIPILAELFRISAVFPPFHAEFVKFRFSIPFIWAIKLGIFIHKSLKNPTTRGHLWSWNHHNKNRLGLRPRPKWGSTGGSLQCSPKSPSRISIYRPFGPLLSRLYCRLFGPSLWVIPLFWFSNVGMSVMAGSWTLSWLVLLLLLFLLLFCCVADQSHGVNVGGGVHKVHKLADEAVAAAYDETNVTPWPCLMVTWLPPDWLSGFVWSFQSPGI